MLFSITHLHLSLKLGRILKALSPIAVLLILFSACADDKEPFILDNTNSNLGDTSQTVTFSGLPSTAEIIMYEVNLRAFSQEGNLAGVTAKLDHIKSLGVNVIWLMPIHPIGTLKSKNSPYCVKNYRAVNPEFGSLADLQELVNEAHTRNMAVILDWVANHTAWDHPWTSTKSWYTQDANGNIVHPPGTDWQDVADLNFNNNQMRSAMLEAMQYWVDVADIDGFRCDYADGVPFDFWQNALKSLRSNTNKDLLFFAEGARKDHFAADFDLAFGWDFYGALKNTFNGQSANLITAAHSREYQNTPAGKHWVRFTTNHDESAWDATPISLFNGADGALAASAIATFTGGVPLIYGSQEVGIAQTIPFFSQAPINWDNNSVLLDQYKKLFQYYKASSTGQKGATTTYPANNIFALNKNLNGNEIWLLVNVRAQNVVYNLPSPLQNTQWVNGLNQNTVNLGSSLSLAPYEFIILEK